MHSTTMRRNPHTPTTRYPSPSPNPRLVGHHTLRFSARSAGRGDLSVYPWTIMPCSRSIFLGPTPRVAAVPRADWYRMDFTSDHDAAAGALEVDFGADGTATIRTVHPSNLTGAFPLYLLRIPRPSRSALSALLSPRSNHTNTRVVNEQYKLLKSSNLIVECRETDRVVQDDLSRAPICLITCRLWSLTQTIGRSI